MEYNFFFHQLYQVNKMFPLFYCPIRIELNHFEFKIREQFLWNLNEFEVKPLEFASILTRDLNIDDDDELLLKIEECIKSQVALYWDYIESDSTIVDSTIDTVDSTVDSTTIDSTVDSTATSTMDTAKSTMDMDTVISNMDKSSATEIDEINVNDSTTFCSLDSSSKTTTRVSTSHDSFDNDCISIDSIENNTLDSIENNTLDSIENTMDSIHNTLDSIENTRTSSQNTLDSIENYNSIDSILGKKDNQDSIVNHNVDILDARILITVSILVNFLVGFQYWHYSFIRSIRMASIL